MDIKGHIGTADSLSEWHPSLEPPRNAVDGESEWTSREYFRLRVFDVARNPHRFVRHIRESVCAGDAREAIAFDLKVELTADKIHWIDDIAVDTKFAERRLHIQIQTLGPFIASADRQADRKWTARLAGDSGEIAEALDTGPYNLQIDNRALDARKPGHLPGRIEARLSKTHVGLVDEQRVTPGFGVYMQYEGRFPNLVDAH